MTTVPTLRSRLQELSIWWRRRRVQTWITRRRRVELKLRAAYDARVRAEHG